MNVLLIASLTIRESSRRRLLVTIAAATLVLVALTAWAFHALATVHGTDGKPVDHYSILVAASTIEILMAFMFSFVLALSASFLGGLSTGNEIENGTLLAIVPRPIRRAEIIVGKWLGNVILIAGYALIVAWCEFGVVWLITGYLPPHPARATGFLIAQSTLLLTLTMTLSVRLSALASGFTTVVLFGIAWIGGITGSVAAVLHNASLQSAVAILSLIVPSDGLWRAASFSMQPVLMAAASQADVNPLTPAAPPPPAYFVWCLLWVLAVLAFGVRSFQTRDI
ncbi:MAG TPA: ABC transporter permease subunit [Candidatus Baltobacteraceae bacterium]|jgi:ABC-type transport system involved in multi-copper enzyme maturation permease subunit|nr:ABC transporter permease subunit [Candidatus Baltobacteraceae bacterium]